MKNIAEMYAEELKSISISKNGRPDPLETSRLKVELQYKFWRPIADIVDPRDRYTKPGAAAQAFFSRGQGQLAAYEMEESRKLMQAFLGVPRLGFGTWFHL